MRVATVTQMKGGRPPDNRMPREGSKLRECYDDLRTGRAVDCGHYVTQLQDFYGMELLHQGRGAYKLVGEWFGKEYVPMERLS